MKEKIISFKNMDLMKQDPYLHGSTLKRTAAKLKSV